MLGEKSSPCHSLNEFIEVFVPNVSILVLEVAAHRHYYVARLVFLTLILGSLQEIVHLGSVVADTQKSSIYEQEHC